MSEENTITQRSVTLDNGLWQKLGIIANGRTPRSSPNRVMQGYIAQGVEQELPAIIKKISQWKKDLTIGEKK